MSLPQNIHKTDGALARSFSEELGLNLDFKTNRNILWHSQESRGSEGYFLMKDGECIVTIDNKLVSVFNFSSGNLLKTYSFKHSIHNCFKINEYKILVHWSVRKFSYLNIDKGIYDELDFSGQDFCTYDSAFDPKLKWLAIILPHKTIDFYNVETKEIEKQLDISVYNESVDYIDFFNNGNHLVLRIKKELLIFESHKLTLLYNLDLNTLPIESFCRVAQIQETHALVETHYGELHWIDLRTGKLKKSADFNMYKNNCNLFKWGSKYLVVNQSGVKGDVIVNFKLIDNLEFKVEQNVNIICDIKPYSINICNDYFMGLTENKEILVFNREFEQVNKIDLPMEMYSLDRYQKELGWFIFDDLLFNIKSEQAYVANYEDCKLSMLDDDFDEANYHVFLLKDKLSPKQRKLLFINLENNERHVFSPLELDKQFTRINVKYLAHLNLWLIVYASNITIYNADTQSVVKHYKPNDLPILPNNHWSRKIFPQYSLGANIYDYSPAKGFLQMFNIHTQKKVQQTFDYNFNSDDLHLGESYAYSLLEATKRNALFLIEVFTTEETKKSSIQLSEYDQELVLLRKSDLVIDDFEPLKIHFKNSFVFDESEDRIIVAGKSKRKITIYSLNVSNLNSQYINEVDYDGYRKFTLDVSKNGKYLSIFFEGEHVVHLLSLSSKQWLGKIEDIHSEFVFRNYDENNNLFVAANRYYTGFYRIEPFSHLGNLYLDPRGIFHIGLFPDSTSPNGWFYTNTPEKISVVKTKADGSEPELLPIDDEDRRAFIKHHNRKDIVMKMLFEPEKYAEFAKLNASAEDLAKHDMAIELSKVEAKRLNNADSK